MTKIKDLTESQAKHLPKAGHAHEELRDAFQDALSARDSVRLDRVTGLLWSCTDVMPASVCDDAGVPVGSTYAQGARAVRDTLEFSEVWVRRQWDDWRRAKYSLDAVTGLHWGHVSGGIMSTSPHEMLYGYVSCEGMIEGELAHSCMHGQGPHRIKVVVVAKDNPNVLMKQLKSNAAFQGRPRTLTRVSA